MKVYNDPADENRAGELTVTDALRLIQERRMWLRSDDKRKLCEKHSMALSTLESHLQGKVKKFNLHLINDALDIANKKQAAIRARI